MTQIFGQCSDTYGSCIRQYCIFGLSAIISLLSIYSLVMTVRKNTHNRFEVLPLLVNIIGSLVMLVTVALNQQENVYIIMGVIQFYTYLLLTYSYAGLYMLVTNKISKQEFRKIKILFILLSIIFGLVIIFLILIQVFKNIQCRESHGTAHVILSISYLILYIIAFEFVRKTKNRIKMTQQQNHQNEKSQLRLLQKQDQYIKIRIDQANLLILSLSVSLVLHIVGIILFFVNQNSCAQENFHSTQNIYEVIMLLIFNLTNLIPHLSVPYILYYLPSRIIQKGESVFLISKVRDSNFISQGSNVIFSQFQSQKINKMASQDKKINR